MSKLMVTVSAIPLLLVPVCGYADAWTDGQAEWAKHGFHHGNWDCYGKCPEGKSSTRAERAPQRSAKTTFTPERGASFDGAWSASSGGYCASAGISQVIISGHNVTGNNVSGSVSTTGTVHTVGLFNGMTIIGSGRISGASASGVYRQSDGCSGSWSAYKL